MRLLQYSIVLVFILAAKFTVGQQSGFILAPEVFVGYNLFTEVYHPNPLAQPKNAGFNTAFQYGGTTGYKFDQWGFLLDYKRSHYQQNFNENQQKGDVKTHYNAFGLRVLYQIDAIKRSKYFHTVKLGYLLNIPQSAEYLNKNDVTGEIYADEDQLYALNDVHMLVLEYGITTGYKLLWADFSIKTGFGLNNIYKPLTNINANNFFIGVQLAFGLFAKTNN